MNTTEEEGMVGMNEKEKKYYDNFVRAVLSLQNEEEVKEFFELVYQYELTDEQVSEILDNRQK